MAAHGHAQRRGARHPPPWKVELANLVGLDRFSRLSIVQGRHADFLSAGDVVKVEGEGLVEVVSRIVP
ncbi:MAG: hypothetical protein AAGA48_33290 [Myxococcota bacterium]